MKMIYPREEVCIACRYCEIYCAIEHSRSKDPVKTFKMESPQPLPRITLMEEGALSFSLQCRHCKEPDCAYACITGAMYKDKESGVVIHDPNRCIGCWTCILACTKGSIRRDESKRVAVKCDLCTHLEVPACVANCPNGALLYLEAV